MNAMGLKIFGNRGVGDVFDGEGVSADFGRQVIAVEFEATAVCGEEERAMGGEEREAVVDESRPVAIDVEDVFGAFGIREGGGIEQDCVEAARVSGLGFANLEVEEFHDVHACDGADASVSETVDVHVLDGPVEIGVGEIHGLDEVGTALEGSDAQGAGVGEEVENAFIFCRFGEDMPQGTMIEKEAGVEKIREVDAEFEVAFRDDAGDGFGRGL